MRAGELDRKVRLEQATLAANDFGEQIKTWSLLAEVWASRAVLSGTETFDSDQIAATALYRFRMYYRTDLDARCRIVYEGKNYNIKFVAEIGRREGLDVTAELINP
jgi:SPP1 family predicted phage head-tail adaptor